MNPFRIVPIKKVNPFKILPKEGKPLDLEVDPFKNAFTSYDDIPF